MDSQRSVNTSTLALLSNVESQSVFEKYQREEEAIQKYYKYQKMIEQSYLDPYEYFLDICNQIEYTENIIEQLNYILFEEPKIKIQQKIDNAKQKLAQRGKNIPSHLDLYLEEKYASEKIINFNTNIQTFRRAYQQNRYLKDKKEAEISNWRSQKVQEFLQEQEIYSYFDTDKYFYDDNIKVPLGLLYKNLDQNKVMNFDEQESLFSVRSVKTNPLQEMVEQDITKYKDYLLKHYQQAFSIQIFPPPQIASSIRQIKLPIKLPSQQFQEQQLISSRSNKLLTADDQDNIDQQIVLLSSRLERTQSRCDVLMKQYLMKQSATTQIFNDSSLKEIREDIKRSELQQNDDPIQSIDDIYDKQDSNKLDKLKERKNQKEIALKGKDGWLEDEMQIMYAYDVNDQQMELYNTNTFERLNRLYTQIECEFYFFESSKRQEKSLKIQHTKKILRIKEFLKNNIKLCKIFHHLFILAALDQVPQIFPFVEHVYPLYNCNYEKNVLPHILNKINCLQSKIQQLPNKLKSISEREIESEELHVETTPPLIAIWRVFKKNKRKPLEALNKFTIPQIKSLNRLFSKGISQIDPKQDGRKIHKVLEMELIKEESNMRSSQESDKDLEKPYSEEDEIGFNNLQKDFYEIYSARSSSRNQIESSSSRSSLQEKQKEQKLLQLIPLSFRYKKLSKNKFAQAQQQSKQSNMIQSIKSDYFINNLIQSIFIANIPTSKSNSSKQRAKVQSQNNDFEQRKSSRQSINRVLDEDLVKAASVCKRSGKKDKFKIRWLELRCFTFAWYKSAPSLVKDEQNGDEIIVQKKPNGYGDLQVAQIEDVIIAKKHCFTVKLPTRNLTIEYDSTRVGLMWSKTIRNIVALKAYIHYLILFGGKGTLFQYFNDLNIKELNLSQHTLCDKDMSRKYLSLELKLTILIFDTITAHQKLQIINFKNSGLSPTSIKELFKYLSKPLKLTRINFIDLSQNDLDQETIRQLNVYLQGQNCQTLQSLIIDDCNLKDELFSLILDAIKQRYQWQMINYDGPVKKDISEEISWRQVSLRYSNKSNPNSARGEQIYFFKNLSFAGNLITDKGLQRFMKTIEEISLQAQPFIKDLEEFEMINLNLSRNKFITELSNFGSFIQSRQIFSNLYLDNLINPQPEQLANFILSFQNNYRMQTLSLRGNPLSNQGYINLIKVLDENFTIDEIIVDFSTYHTFQNTHNQECKQLNNLRSQFFSFSLYSNEFKY